MVAKYIKLRMVTSNPIKFKQNLPSGFRGVVSTKRDTRTQVTCTDTSILYCEKKTRKAVNT